MAAENIDNTVTGTGLFNAKIPGLSDAADIQAALRLYHYGSYDYDGTNTNTANLLTPSIAKHLQNLVDTDATKAPLANANFTTAITTPNNTGSKISFYYADVASFPAASTAHGAIAHAHDTGKLYLAHAGSWIALASQAYVDSGIDNAEVDQSLLAGTGIDWNSVSSQFDISSNLTLISPHELATISATAATGAINIDVVTSSVNIRTSNAAANWTINIRGDGTTTLNSLMAIGEQISVVFESLQGGTAYYPTALTIDGASVTPKWLGGIAPSSGNINSTDVYVYTIRKTGASAFSALASQNKFA